MDVAELVKGWSEGWSTNEVDRLAEIFTDDCVYEDVTLGLVHHGRAAVQEFRRAYVAVFPDLGVDDITYFADGTSACVSWTMSGTHEGDLPDLPAGGRRFSLRGVSVLTLADGKFASCRDYWDRTTLLHQLGADA